MESEQEAGKRPLKKILTLHLLGMSVLTLLGANKLTQGSKV